MEFSWLILCTTFLLILISYVRQYKIRKLSPPGPLGLPFVGRLPQEFLITLFSSYLPKMYEVKFFRDMRDKYGYYWSLPMGGQRIIVLASYDLMHEAFIENAKMFSGRPFLENIKILGEGQGISFADGDEWHNDRQYSIKAMRELGMGKPMMEHRISNEIDVLMDYIDSRLSKPFTSPYIFVKPISNITSELIFNDTNRYDDPVLEAYVKDLKYVIHSNSAQMKLNFFIKLIPTKYSRKIFSEIDQFIKSTEGSMRFIMDKCKARLKVEGEYSKPTCMFDYYWRFHYQDDKEISDERKLFKISHTLYDIYFGGIDTSTNALSFACLYLAEHTGIQNELRAEIQSVAENYKTITYEMRKSCPKILSFLDEIQRYFHLVPRVYHRTLKPFTFRGYKIEIDDVVYADLANIMRDPKVFVNPDEFDTYRFMDETRTKYVPNKSVVPFGLGRRACVGESMAVVQMFLFFSKLIYKYKFSLTEETKAKFEEILIGDFAIVHAPIDHGIIFQIIDSKSC